MRVKVCLYIINKHVLLNDSFSVVSVHVKFPLPFFKKCQLKFAFTQLTNTSSFMTAFFIVSIHVKFSLASFIKCELKFASTVLTNKSSLIIVFSIVSVHVKFSLLSFIKYELKFAPIELTNTSSFMIVFLLFLFMCNLFLNEIYQKEKFNDFLSYFFPHLLHRIKKIFFFIGLKSTSSLKILLVFFLYTCNVFLQTNNSDKKRFKILFFPRYQRDFYK